jgi:hypothetical protein
MKKINALILGSLILLASMAGAQDRRYVKKLPQGISREAELQCPANSLFSQGPMFWMAVSPQDQPIADDYTTAGQPTSIRFWGFDMSFETYLTCTPPEMTFQINFYERNTSDPTIPGAQFATYTLTTIPQYFVMYDMDLFQIDLNFPGPVALTDGWVSIDRISETGDPCWAFITGNDGIGGNACVYWDGWVHSTDVWGMEFAPDLCLSGQVQDVPITNWALVIGIILIGTFIVIRFRKLV